MAINSRQKGKRGELAAVDFLKSLGFTDARRSQQFCGAAGDADVVCPSSLPNVFIEVKFDVGGLRFGTKHYDTVIEQLIADASSCKLFPVLLWKSSMRPWLLTQPGIVHVTYHRPQDIKMALEMGNRRA